MILSHYFWFALEQHKFEKIDETTLLKHEFFKSWGLAGKGTSPVLKRGLITSGESGSSSPVYQGPEASLDGMSDCRLGLSPGIDEFLMNMVRFNLKEVFSAEFKNVMGQFSSGGSARQKMEKKKKGKAKFLDPA